MTAPAIERIRVLSNELSKALEEWIETDMGGEVWGVRIHPQCHCRPGVFLENLDCYPGNCIERDHVLGGCHEQD